MWVFRAFLAVVIFAVLLGFSVYNAEERVTVTILNTRYINMPLIYVAYWAFLFGLIVSFLLAVTVYLHQSGEIRRQRRMIDSLNNEVAALRNRSIDGAGAQLIFPNKEDGQ